MERIFDVVVDNLYNIVEIIARQIEHLYFLKEKMKEFTMFHVDL